MPPKSKKSSSSKCKKLTPPKELLEVVNEKIEDSVTVEGGVNEVSFVHTNATDSSSDDDDGTATNAASKKPKGSTSKNIGRGPAALSLQSKESSQEKATSNIDPLVSKSSMTIATSSLVAFRSNWNATATSANGTSI